MVIPVLVRSLALAPIRATGIVPCISLAHDISPATCEVADRAGMIVPSPIKNTRVKRTDPSVTLHKIKMKIVASDDTLIAKEPR